MNLWWCGWKVPDSVPLEDIVELWPRGMQGWITGYDDGHMRYVGIVLANTKQQAWNCILSCYGGSAGEISERFAYEHDPRKQISGFPRANEFIRNDLLPVMNAMRRAAGEPEVGVDELEESS